MNSRLIYVSNIKNSCAPLLLLLKKLDIYLELISFIVSHFAAFFFRSSRFHVVFPCLHAGLVQLLPLQLPPSPSPRNVNCRSNKKNCRLSIRSFFFCFFDRSQNARFGNHFFFKFFVFFGSDNMYMFVGFRYNVNISYHH